MATRIADMPKGIIFDFDGTIIDTEMPDYLSWQATFHIYGGELPFEVWAEYIGRAMDSFDIYGYLEEQVGRALDREMVRVERRRRLDELMAAEPLRPGIADYLVDIERMGLLSGVASSASRAWVMGNLKKRRLAARFQVISTADDVQHAKPDPAVFVHACRLLDVRPEQVIAIEDSPNGVLAAKRAGMFTVAVPNELTSRLDMSQADLHLHTLAEMPLADLLETAQGRPTRRGRGSRMARQSV